MNDNTKDLFTSEGSQTDQTADTSLKVDDNKNYYEEMVGEGKKYSSVEELAKGKANADALIEHLQNKELAGLRDEYNALKQEYDRSLKLEEFLEKIESNRSTGSNPAHTNQDETNSTQSSSSTGTLTEDTVKNLINNAVQQDRTMREAERNVEKIHSTAQEMLGNEYRERLTERANELKLDQELLSELAAKNPDGFIKVMVEPIKSNEGKQFTGAPETSVNSSAIVNTNHSGERGKSYYDKIRREDSRLYWSPKTQMEIFEQVKKLGQETFDKL